MKTCGKCQYANNNEGNLVCSLMKSYDRARNVGDYEHCKLENLGKKDIESIIEHKDYYINESERMIQYQLERINTLNNLKQEKLASLFLKVDKKMIEGFEKVTDRYGDSEPVWDEKTTELTSGDSNFLYCGWCKYASGSHRYGACLSGRCSLSKEGENEVAWDIPCHIMTKNEKEIKEIIKDKEKEIKNYKGRIKLYKDQIEILKNIKAKDIPPLPRNRSHDHFNIEDKIMIFPTFEGSLIKDRWIEGEVIDGYRHHDGCVSGKIYEKYHNGDYLNGHGFGSGYQIPFVMKKTEYEFFVKDPKAFQEWIKNACSESFNGNVYDYKNIAVPK
jgi:hypothetical protein